LVGNNDLLKEKNRGRPTAITGEVMQKLELAFMLGANKTTAAAFAGIARETLKVFIKKNPDFIPRIEMLREKPVIKALKTIYENLNDPKNAQWLLSKKLPSEYGDKVALEHSGGLSTTIADGYAKECKLIEEKIQQLREEFKNETKQD